MDGIERVWKIGGFSGWAAINLDRKKMRMAPQMISYGNYRFLYIHWTMYIPAYVLHCYNFNCTTPTCIHDAEFAHE